MNTLSNVFFAIAKDNLHTRKDIAIHLGVSIVTVGKAVDTLIKSGLICPIGKGSGDTGRKSDFIDVSQSQKVLLINLCEKDLAYTFSPMSEDFIDICTIPYSHSLDFADNVSFAGMSFGKLEERARHISLFFNKRVISLDEGIVVSDGLDEEDDFGVEYEEDYYGEEELTYETE